MAKKKVKEINELVEEVKVAPKEEAPKVLKFPKKKLVESKRFAKHRDLVNVLLKEDETYSIVEVENLIKDFLRGNKK